MRVAVTGGVAEGKSTVVDNLRELGYTTDSADRIAAEVLHDPDVQERLAKDFDLTTPVTSDQLRPIVFKNPAARRKLNEATHPKILAKMLESEATFMEVPLLIETCLQGWFDQVWVVTCGPEEQLKRLSARLNDGAKAKAIIASQLPTASKLPFADCIVRTNLPRRDVFRFVATAAHAIGLEKI